MPDDFRSDTSSEQTPDASVPKREPPTDTVIQQGFPLVAHDPQAPSPPAGYEYLGVVGRGGMGIVYRAHDLSLNRDVAIKILHERYPTDGSAARQFLDEAQITAQLQHPGIPPIHEIGTLAEGRPYLVMKLIKGHTLDVLLADNAELGRLLAIFESLCETVGYAHGRGVIHRDLKPSNVMVGAFGEVQVMDWGLAKQLRNVDCGTRNETQGTASFIPQSAIHIPQSDETLPGSVMGTPGFMSPEQATGEIAKIDRRADVFSLGGVLCEILTNRPPYTGGSASEIQQKAVLGDTVEAFAALDACGADPELIVLTKRCLNTNPDDRPHDASEVAKAVAKFRAATEARARQAELDHVRAEAEREVTARVSSSQITSVAKEPPTAVASRRAVLLGVPAVAAVAVVGVYFAFRNRDRTPDSTSPPPPPPPPVPPAVLVAKRDLEGYVAGVAVSDDGRWLAVAFGDWDLPLKVGGVKLFDRSLGNKPHVWWKWGTTACRGVAFSPDGKWLAVAAGDALRVVNLSDGQEVEYAGAKNPDCFAQSVAFSPNGKYLAMGLDRTSAENHTPRPGFVRVWDVATQVQANPAHFERNNFPIRCVAFSSDSALLAAGFGMRVNDLSSAVEVWNVKSGAHVAQLNAPLAVRGPYTAFARSAPLCAISSQDEVRIYQSPNLEPFKNPFVTNPAGEASALALRRDGVIIAFAVGGNIHLGEAKTGTVYATLEKHAKDVSSLTFTLDGKTLISGGHDSIVREWVVSDPK